MNNDTPRKEIVKAISKGAKLSMGQASEVLQSLTEIMKQELLSGGSFHLPGLCVVYYSNGKTNYTACAGAKNRAIFLRQSIPVIATRQLYYEKGCLDE